MRPTRSHRLRRLVACVALLAPLGACGRLEDALSPGRRADETPARVALAARLPALSKSRAATVQLRVQAFYARADGTRVPLASQRVTLDDAPTQQVPITIDLSTCLADAQRAADPAGGCVVTLDITLVDGDRVMDRQTVGPLALQAGGMATVAEPVQLVEVAGVRVGPALGGATTGDGSAVRVELGASVALGAAITSTAGQPVSGRPVAWASDAPDVAHVDAQTGVVLGAALGRARVTATTFGGSGSVDVAVVPRPSTITVSGVGAGGSGSVQSSPAGIDCRVAAGQAQGACAFTFPGDARVTLTATPDFGTAFGTWGGACASSGGATTCELDAAQVRGATVSFAAQRRLTVAGSGVGTVSGVGIACQIGDAGATGTCAGGYPDGAVVTLTASAGAQHAFAGWSGACADTSPTCTVTMTSDQSVGARFSAPLALTVAGAGEGSGTVTGEGLACAFRGGAGAPCATTLAFGAVATLTATPDANSTFAGWTGACGGTGACRVTMDQARSVGATFGRRQVTLTLALGGVGAGSLLVSGGGACTLAAGAGAAECAVRVPVGQPVTITAARGTGAEFAGWSGACAGRGTDACALTPTADMTVGARFTAELVPLSVQSAPGTTGGGRVTAGAALNCTIVGAAVDGTCAGSVPYGSTVTLVATPNATSTFGGWGGACRVPAGATCVVPVTSAAAVTARFDAIRYPLAVARVGGGGGAVRSAPAAIDCPAGACAATFALGTSVTLVATPDAGSAFAGWTGACTGAGPTCVVSVNAAQSATAAFVPVHVLDVSVVSDPGAGGRVTSSPAGIDCPWSCARGYAAGTTVTLTAVPGAGSVFDGWTGACAGSSPTCVVTLSSARSVGARFVPATFSSLPGYTLSVLTAGTGAGTVTSAPAGVSCPGACDAKYAAATTVTLTARSSAGNFIGWSGACSGTGACVVAMSQTRTVTATFRK